MRLRSRVVGLLFAADLTARLGDLLCVGLRLFKIGRNGKQDLARMVAKGLLIQRFAAMRDSRGKFIPGLQYLVSVLSDEVGEPHGCPFCWSTTRRRSIINAERHTARFASRVGQRRTSRSQWAA
jgi:hypothetical protein